MGQSHSKTKKQIKEIQNEFENELEARQEKAKLEQYAWLYRFKTITWLSNFRLRFILTPKCAIIAFSEGAREERS